MRTPSMNQAQVRRAITAPRAWSPDTVGDRVISYPFTRSARHSAPVTGHRLGDRSGSQPCSCDRQHGPFARDAFEFDGAMVGKLEIGADYKIANG